MLALNVYTACLNTLISLILAKAISPVGLSSLVVSILFCWCHCTETSRGSLAACSASLLVLDELHRFLGSTGEPLRAAAAVASSGLSWFVLLKRVPQALHKTGLEGGPRRH